ncbi:MAG: succinylglutamate desuccinylase/aspartoacylase family protein [Anaerolineaceae bacterium]|nr:succinylglutamate desuccinylase/aspartoacylase family protein [Anaerolineaceae bacterium]
MKKELCVGNLSAKQGEKVTGNCTFIIDGKTFSLPVFLINGKAEGPTFVITAGVHAAEYASIAAAIEIGQKYSPETIQGQLIVVPVINQAGFPVRSIYVNPMDGINLNRVFPGNPDGSASEQITAWVFENIMKQADYYIDLHGGDLIESLIPFVIFPEVGKADVDHASLELAKTMGIEYLIRKVGTSGSTFLAVADAGIPAVLVESGGQGIWPREDVVRLIDGVERAMVTFGMLPEITLSSTESILLKDFIWLMSDHIGFWYPQIEVGDQVKEGQVLGKITDIWGSELQTAHATADGRILFLVSSLSINVGDPLLSIGA